MRVGPLKRMTSAVAETISVENLIKGQAYGLGFDLVGITTLGPAETASQFEKWIANGYAGEMEYLARGAAKRRNSRLPFEGAISAIVVGLNYGGREATGPIARYARGDDYHELMTARLRELHQWVEQEVGHPVSGKAYVDTGPILERDLARRAGLGWFGKNTNLVNPRLGSFFFIGALLVDLELNADAPFEADRCGSCRRCLDACPTGAFVDERVLDATKCISYLTIEAKGAIPVELRESIGGLVYGCDVCQDVCPWNVRFSREVREEAFQRREILNGESRTIARALLSMDSDSFSSDFKGSPMKRAKRPGLMRNAAVALGNVGNENDLDLLRAARVSADPMVRTHIDWAIARIESN
jgi:epoxyqueuosine reductase